MRDRAGRIGIIDEIARNTNLMALNTEIEAARAGQLISEIIPDIQRTAGRGFNQPTSPGVQASVAPDQYLGFTRV